MSYENAPNRVSFPFNHASVFEDTDGTLTGTSGGASYLPFMEILNPAHCTENAAASFGAVKGALCTQGKFRRMAWNNMHPSSIDGKDAFLTNAHGTDTVKWRKKAKSGKPSGYTALMEVGGTLKLTFANSSQFTNISFDMSIAELEDADTGILEVCCCCCYYCCCNHSNRFV